VGDAAGGGARKRVSSGLRPGWLSLLPGADLLAFPTERTTPSVAGAVSPAGGSAASVGPGRADGDGGSADRGTGPAVAVASSASGASAGAAAPDDGSGDWASGGGGASLAWPASTSIGAATAVGPVAGSDGAGAATASGAGPAAAPMVSAGASWLPAGGVAWMAGVGWGTAWGMAMLASSANAGSSDVWSPGSSPAAGRARPGGASSAALGS
jgi:hypothetical protein